MRKRAIPILLIAGIVWFIYWRLVEPLWNSPFGYELGSVAWPMPLHLRLIGWAAFLSSVLGISLLVFDFVRWVVRKKP